MNWLRRLLHKSRNASQLDKELRFHLEQQIDDYVAAGMSPQESRRRAQQEFGGLERVNFLSEPAEDAGISALQPNHFQASAGRFNHSRVDFRLGRTLGTVALADAEDFGLGSSESENRRRHEIVVQNQCGAREEPLGFHGQ